MGNGLYVDDGAHNIHAIRCSFYGCEKLGVFVGDIGTSVMVRVCMTCFVLVLFLVHVVVCMDSILQNIIFFFFSLFPSSFFYQKNTVD